MSASEHHFAELLVAENPLVLEDHGTRFAAFSPTKTVMDPANDTCSDLAAAPADARHRRLLLILFAAVLAYSGAYVLVFLASPIGRFPVLDGLENSGLAQQTAANALPPEPFYRAMLYPLLLSFFLRAGMAAASLPIVAGILGTLFHLGATICVYQLAERAWTSRKAGLVAAALFGLNPVAIYFSAELLDTTFALFLFLASLNAFHYALTTRHRASNDNQGIDWHFARWIATGTSALVLAMLARPHYAIVVASLPFILILILWRSPRIIFQALASFLVVAGTLLGATGLIQKNICGHFRVMPAQGAYSLWAGNRPGANGRYFQQQIHIPAGGNDRAENPARIESVRLYEEETGAAAGYDLESVNTYWKKKTIATIRAHPREWLGLMCRKAYYLLNDFEQYNNKTFAVQKALSPVLRFNPLGWGIIMVLCAGGAAVAVRHNRYCRGCWFGSAVAAVYGAGVIIFFVSDRFRLPLLPMLCIGAGAWGCASRDWFASILQPRGAPVLAATAVAALLTFSRAWGVHDRQTAVQDYILLSIASERCGRDVEALQWARRALAERPDHPDALACAVTSFYNAKLQGAFPDRQFADETWELQAQRVTQIPQPAAGVRLVQGVAFWKMGRVTEARDVLQSLIGEKQPSVPSGAQGLTRDDALGVLLLSQLDHAGADELARERLQNTASFYLMVGLERRHDAGFATLPEARKGMATQAEAFVRNIFP